jgi:hypothetical protein
MDKRGSLFWGVILIIVAGLLLLRQMGIIVGDIFGYFWPLLIIALGIWLIIGFFSRNQPVEGEKVSIPLEGAGAANIKIDHAAGRLSLRSGTEPGEILNGVFGNGLSYKSSLEANRLEVRLRPSRQFWVWWPGENMDWNICLNRDIPLKLKIDSGASASVLDLHDLKVTDLDIDTGASTTELTLPANAGNTHAEIDTGASSVKITVPAGVAASIRIKSGIASVNVNSRFASLGSGSYQSDDFASSANRLDLAISAGVGSIEIN